MQLPISEIVVGKRFRKNLGDLNSLCESMDELGQLQDIVITHDRRLLAGFRRLEAAKMLGWSTVRVYVAKDLTDAVEHLQAERDENTCRMAFSSSEQLAVNDAILAIEKPKAAERIKAGKGEDGSGGRGHKKENPVKTSHRDKEDKKTRTKSAKAAGTSAPTIRKIRAIVDSGDTDLINKMDETGKVDRVFKELKAKEKAEADQAAAKAATKIIAKQTKQDEHNIFLTDFQEGCKVIPDESISLIFTDPPYHREHVPLFADLATLADRVLVDGGSLITFCGMVTFNDVMKQLEAKRLRYFWICCVWQTGTVLQMNDYGIKNHWKPLLWFVKGQFRRDRETFVEDRIESRQEKGHHPWQQSVIEAKHFIEKLTRPGEIVLDPFCGGGTTAVAAKELGRKWLTFDTDPVAIKTARERIIL